MTQNFLSNSLNPFANIGRSIGTFIKNMPNVVKNKKNPMSAGYNIKSLKTTRTLEDNFKKYLGVLIKEFLDTETMNKVKSYNDWKRIGKNSLAPILIKVTVDQCFTSEPQEDFMSIDIIEDNPAIRGVLEEIPKVFCERTKYKKIIEDNLFTLALYGELFLKKKRNNQGFVKSFEVLEGQYIYPICDDTEILFYLDLSPNIEGSVDLYEPNDIVAFFFHPKRTKIIETDSAIEKFMGELDPEVQKEIPDCFLRGEPLLWDARKPLKKLTMYEVLIDFNTFKMLNLPTLISVQVDKITDETQISELSDKYEEMLTDNSNINNISNILENDADTDDIDYTNFANFNTRVIPVEGTGKNGLQVIDLIGNSTQFKEIVEDTKKEVLQLAGYPMSILELDSMSSSEVKNDLQTNKRFRNNCIRFQNTISEPTKEVFFKDAKHYKLQGYDFKPETFNITFKNIVSLDDIEDLEIHIAKLSQMRNSYDTLKAIADNSEFINLDERGWFDFIENNMKDFKAGYNLLRISDEPKSAQGGSGATGTSPDEFEELDNADDAGFVGSPNGTFNESLDNSSPDFNKGEEEVPEEEAPEEENNAEK